ncbi:MAG: YiiX/YebB-like N1pC/P60 family cysteine hydrolase [Hyphomicrobium sp.]
MSPPSATVLPFYADLEALEALVYRPLADAASLERTLDEIYARVADADFARYDIAAVKADALKLIYRLFDLRLALRSQIAEYERRGFMSRAVVQRVRDCLRILRYVTDMLGEMASGQADKSGAGVHARGFAGRNHNTLVNWNFYNGRDLEFRTGDVILMRGRAHNSAAIARIGDVDSQFSHLAIVHIDAAGNHSMVECLIEEGAVINPLGHTLEHGLVRSVLYRHRDADLAARAADMIYAHVAASHRPLARRINYDFTMRLDDGYRLFCSKLVRNAFSLASNGTTRLPSYPTRIAMQNRDFLDRIGVKADETFAPADIDLEPAFDLVCEWQDYRETSNIRLQDFTMDKLFEWMDEHGYRFEETSLVKLIAVFGRASAYMSKELRSLISDTLPRVPRNMKRRTIATVAMLHKTAEPILNELQALEAETVARTGRPLHGREIFEHLERIRLREGDEIGYLRRPSYGAASSKSAT